MFIGSRGKESTPPDFLNVSLKDPFQRPNGWATWAIYGLAGAPVVLTVASVLYLFLPVEVSTTAGTLDAVAGMFAAIDNHIFINLLLVTGVLAPILEETVFRGFLLTSLTKHMSVPAAVVWSSLLFAICHFSEKDFLQLFALGMVMGFAYCRSRNLLTSMLIHGAWNSTVLGVVYVLVSSGVAMDDILGK